jgi:hypothetical protein
LHNFILCRIAFMHILAFHDNNFGGSCLDKMVTLSMTMINAVTQVILIRNL